MPLVLRSDVRVQDNRHGDHRLGECFLELEVREHEGREAHAHGESAHHEAEDVAAAIFLREVRREMVAPTVGLLEKVERG